GYNVAAGGSGDSGGSTALGVFSALRAAAAFKWGEEGLRGRTVGVEGAGKVGYVLIDLLRRDGAKVVVTDPSPEAVRRVTQRYGDTVQVAGTLAGAPIDVYAPCALGATLNEESVRALNAELVCGAANNQLDASDVDALLFKRGITWVPDYVANAGGVIQVGGELLHHSTDEVLAQVSHIGETTTEILTRSSEAGITTGTAAAELVHARLNRTTP
ncbi:MAG: Glu/Leu/Phe/Val dehydrogenase family protein, partial [Trebonia sp.]